ncbi:MAG: hypothetical protein PHZ11_07265 [Desulfitobacteriaceae bacterium]|nr:hypothetical protein [Desulfitobacteriaceae bacterium]
MMEQGRAAINNNTSEQRVKRTIMLMATAGSFLTPFMVSSINIALPAIQNDFAANAILLSWIATSYLLSSAIVCGFSASNRQNCRYLWPDPGV